MSLKTEPALTVVSPEDSEESRNYWWSPLWVAARGPALVNEHSIFHSSASKAAPENDCQLAMTAEMQCRK